MYRTTTSSPRASTVSPEFLDRNAARFHVPLKRSGETLSELDLLQGTLDVLVLKTLTWGPKHGYAVAQWLRSASDDRILVEDKALYVALHRLEARGLIESEWGVSENNRKAKFYAITKAGRAQLKAETENWERISGVIGRVLQPIDPGLPAEASAKAGS